VILDDCNQVLECSLGADLFPTFHTAAAVGGQ
jgi:hypothetical protein